MKKVVEVMELYGFTAVVTPGPFIRSTFGHTKTLMPFCTASTYDALIKLLPEAEKLAAPDPDHDLEGASESSYGNHSLRQLADRQARELKHLSKASDVDIDRMFGWCEAVYRKVMSLHYAGRHDRVRRKWITGYM